ncbi:MAG: T9SS type A sorting domain-containing protein [Flavobacteriaceae bacterium]|nr:T9SS type A sorting domain-containing protein [Flavobacteriaceae bacterium]
MKKLIFLLVFYHTYSISQNNLILQNPNGDIVNVIVTPVNETTINVYSIVHFINITDYFDHNINIENNIIELNLCYQSTVFPEEDFVTHNDEIDVTGLSGEYSLIISIFDNSEGCYVNELDSETMSFSLPLEDEVQLSNPTFNLKSKIKAYPNPVKNILQITNNSNSAINSIQVYDVLGKLILQENNPTSKLDVSSLKSGLFFVQITTDKGVVTKKVVKQ